MIVILIWLSLGWTNGVMDDDNPFAVENKFVNFDETALLWPEVETFQTAPTSRTTIIIISACND